MQAQLPRFKNHRLQSDFLITDRVQSGVDIRNPEYCSLVRCLFKRRKMIAGLEKIECHERPKFRGAKMIGADARTVPRPTHHNSIRRDFKDRHSLPIRNDKTIQSGPPHRIKHAVRFFHCGALFEEPPKAQREWHAGQVKPPISEAHLIRFHYSDS
jgi:hypothetical protein